MPFKNHDIKNFRYLDYLKYYAGESTEYPKDLESQWHQEFKMAALMFRPLPIEMKSRFIRPKVTDFDQHSFPPEKNNVEPVHRLLEIPNQFDQNQSRIFFGWSPSSLLCKRFNVPQADVVAANTDLVEENRMLPISVPSNPSNSSLFNRPDLDVFANIFQ